MLVTSVMTWGTLNLSYAALHIDFAMSRFAWSISDTAMIVRSEYLENHDIRPA